MSSIERRQSRRVGTTREIQALILDYLPGQVSLQDVSRTGVAFVSRLPLEMGANLTLMLELQPIGVIEVDIQIQNVEETSPGIYKYGGSFCPPMNDHVRATIAAFVFHLGLSIKRMRGVTVSQRSMGV